MARTTDITTTILREIRDEIVATRTELAARIDSLGESLGARIDVTNAHVRVVETTVLELAEQQRFVVRHLRTLTMRDRRLEEDVTDLRTRVSAIERRMPRRRG